MKDARFEKVLGLLKEDRLRTSNYGSRGILIASESDKGRVVNSGAFRRLQRKAQVFPLDTNAAVRTRLTHSVEVSQVGRHIVQKIVQKLGASEVGSYDTLAAFVNTIETACLLHDIGNPPFGHFGEVAIQEWFVDNHPEIADLVNFDGNPQGFRLMSYLSGADDFGFNLTATLLLSTVKYPHTVASKPLDAKKIGLFAGDAASYELACKHLAWKPGSRFPFVMLMDAADDIAYSMSDLEDGLEKKIISTADLKREFGEERFKLGGVEQFVAFKTRVINDAVEVGADTFVKNLDRILGGENVKLIDKNTDVGALLSKVNDYARANIYSHPAAEEIELAGRSVIKGLLNHFGILLDLDEGDFVNLIDENREGLRGKRLDVQGRFVRRLPGAYKRKYRSAARGTEKERRAHLIVDFVAGMTDEFALHTYQVLEGIKVQ
jgi:dGTPase